MLIDILETIYCVILDNFLKAYQTVFEKNLRFSIKAVLCLKHIIPDLLLIR